MHAVQWREFYRGFKLRTLVAVWFCNVMLSLEIAVMRNSLMRSPTKTVRPLTMALGRVAANKMPWSFGSGGFGGAIATGFALVATLVTIAGTTAGLGTVEAVSEFVSGLTLAASGVGLDSDSPTKIPAATSSKMIIPGTSQRGRLFVWSPPAPAAEEWMADFVAEFAGFV